jgi:hypothetical protein
LEKSPSEVILAPEKSLLKPQPTTSPPDIFENNFYKNSFRQQHFPTDYQKWFSEISPKKDPFPANLMVLSYPKLSLTGDHSTTYTPSLNTGTSTISNSKFSYKGQTQNGLMHGIGSLQTNQEDPNTLAAGLLAIIKTPPLKIIKLTYDGKFKNNKFDGQGNLSNSVGDRYVGGFKNGLKSGSGSLVYANGDKYEGKFVGDFAEGYGVYSFGRGHRWVKGYSGNFHQNMFTGKGELLAKDGTVVKCSFDRNVVRKVWSMKIEGKYFFTGEIRNFLVDGKGYYVFPEDNGYVLGYRGEFVNGVPSGMGRMVSTNFDVFEGRFENGKCNGYGVYHYADSNKNLVKYEGLFRDDRFNGLGTLLCKDKNLIRCKFADGVIESKYVELAYPEDHPMMKSYCGEILFNSKLAKIDMKFDAKGNLIFKDGRAYVGQFDKGAMIGAGVCYYPESEEKVLRYEGEISGWLYTGKGKLYYKNGDLYEGDFKNNKFNGTGMLVYGQKGGEGEQKDWVMYAGEFAKGVFDGKGKVTLKDKTVKDGQFRNGVMRSWNKA